MLRARLKKDDLTETTYDTKHKRMTISTKDGRTMRYDGVPESDFNSIVAAKSPIIEYLEGFIPRHEQRRRRLM